MSEELESARELASSAISWLCVGMNHNRCRETLAKLMGPEKTDISEYTLEDCEKLIQAIDRRRNATH